MEQSIQTPLILVTNDDGVHHRGIAALVEAARELGEVAVVAPDQNRSGVSHMISLMTPLRCVEVRDSWWSVSGTPADCVYVAVHSLLSRRPSLVLSGINAGPNLSYDVHYSGTVGAAMEGTMLGIPSIAFSLTHPKSSFEPASRFAAKLARKVLQEGLPSSVTLNVNVPQEATGRYQMTFQGHRLFRHAVHKRADPRGSPYYWIGGAPDIPKDMPGSDCDAIDKGLISVTPLEVDITHRKALRETFTDFSLPDAERVEGVEPPEDRGVDFS